MFFCNTLCEWDDINIISVFCFIFVQADGKIEEYTVVYLPVEKIVDTNGAGDGFVGGM